MKTNASADIITVTPEMAAEWLTERWGEQRNIRTRHVRRLAADMEAGRFRISPDAILRIKGKLANGQHRLAAVVQAGKPMPFLVMDSKDEELYKVIDAGLHRTVADGLIGMSYAKAAASIARWVQAYELGILKPGARSGGEAGRLGKSTPTQCELIDYCIANEEALSDAASFITPIYAETRLLPMSVGGAIHVIGSSRNGCFEMTKSFLRNVYVDGGASAAGDLRNRLIANRGSRSKLTLGYIFGITIKSLRAYLNDKRLGVLKWAKEEGYPTLD